MRFISAGVSRVADTELILLIAHLIWPPGSIPGVGQFSAIKQDKLLSCGYGSIKCICQENRYLNDICLNDATFKNSNVWGFVGYIDWKVCCIDKLAMPDRLYSVYTDYCIYNISIIITFDIMHQLNCSNYNGKRRIKKDLVDYPFVSHCVHYETNFFIYFVFDRVA